MLREGVFVCKHFTFRLVPVVASVILPVVFFFLKEDFSPPATVAGPRALRKGILLAFLRFPGKCCFHLPATVVGFDHLFLEFVSKKVLFFFVELFLVSFKQGFYVLLFIVIHREGIPSTLVQYIVYGLTHQDHRLLHVMQYFVKAQGFILCGVVELGPQDSQWP